MPETYIEPLTDRYTCFQCNKAASGKKKLLKCGGCEAITYCGVECQKEDRARHKWNCVPVMVTEIEGKGRGLVAARNIKMGELIFVDKPIIRLSNNWGPNTGAQLLSLNSQISGMPSEAKKLWEKLNIPEDPMADRICSGRVEALAARRLILNARNIEGFACLYLNIVLINHSCAPNASLGKKRPGEGDNITEGNLLEARAIKDISKGEEITLCYPDPIPFNELGSSSKGRKAALYKEYRFHCKCCVCSGLVPDQEDIMKEMLKLYKTINPNPIRKKPSDWKREAKILDKIVDLTQQLYIGSVAAEKINSLITLARTAQLARDEELLEKAMDTCSKEVERTQMEESRIIYENMKVVLAEWTTELKGKEPPTKQEIDFFHPKEN